MTHIAGPPDPGPVLLGADLTARERDVLRCLATGKTARAMARQLGVSELTVRKHLEHVYAKMGVHDRLAAVLTASRSGVI